MFKIVKRHIIALNANLLALQQMKIIKLQRIFLYRVRAQNGWEWRERKQDERANRAKKKKIKHIN